MNSARDVGVLIAAAGSGTRMEGSEPKQFRPIAGTPMLLRSIRPFQDHARVLQVIVALPSKYVESPPAWLNGPDGEAVHVVCGGATRGESVKAAFDALKPDCSIVLVHDAARPFVSADTIEKVISVSQMCGAVPAVPLADTLKRGDEATNRVIETVDRSCLWRAQTPQGCPRKLMKQAYGHVGLERISEFTDESALLEVAGIPVEIVHDSPKNFKVTTESDILVAEAILSR